MCSVRAELSSPPPFCSDTRLSWVSAAPQLRHGWVGGQTDRQMYLERDREGLHTWKTLSALLSRNFATEPQHSILSLPLPEVQGDPRPGSIEGRSSGSLCGQRAKQPRLPLGDQLCACTPASPSPTDCWSVTVKVGLLGMHTSRNPGPLFLGSRAGPLGDGARSL